MVLASVILEARLDAIAAEVGVLHRPNSGAFGHRASTGAAAGRQPEVRHRRQKAHGAGEHRERFAVGNSSYQNLSPTGAGDRNCDDDARVKPCAVVGSHPPHAAPAPPPAC